MPKNEGFTLSEVPEAEAKGEIADIYAGLKGYGQVPLVALLYRHLATFPGALSWSWELWHPFLASGMLQAAASRLEAGAVLETANTLSLRQFIEGGISQIECVDIVNVIDAYNRANRLNLISALILCAAIENPLERTAASSGERSPPPAPPAPLLAPASVEDLDAPLRALIESLSSPGQTDGDGIIPTLFRHLANWPQFMMAAGQMLAPHYATGAIAAAAAEVRKQADREADVLTANLAGTPQALLPGDTGKAILRSASLFLDRIPEMIVVGAWLKNAFPHASKT